MFAWQISSCEFIDNTFHLSIQNHASFPKNWKQVIPFQSVRCEVLVLSDTDSSLLFRQVSRPKKCDSPLGFLGNNDLTLITLQ